MNFLLVFAALLVCATAVYRNICDCYFYNLEHDLLDAVEMTHSKIPQVIQVLNSKLMEDFKEFINLQKRRIVILRKDIKLFLSYGTKMKFEGEFCKVKVEFKWYQCDQTLAIEVERVTAASSYVDYFNNAIYDQRLVNMYKEVKEQFKKDTFFDEIFFDLFQTWFKHIRDLSFDQVNFI